MMWGLWTHALTLRSPKPVLALAQLVLKIKVKKNAR